MQCHREYLHVSELNRQGLQFQSFDQKINYTLEDALKSSAASVKVTIHGSDYIVNMPEGRTTDSKGNILQIRQIDRIKVLQPYVGIYSTTCLWSILIISYLMSLVFNYSATNYQVFNFLKCLKKKTTCFFYHRSWCCIDDASALQAQNMKLVANVSRNLLLYKKDI